MMIIAIFRMILIPIAIKVIIHIIMGASVLIGDIFLGGFFKTTCEILKKALKFCKEKPFSAFVGLLIILPFIYLAYMCITEQPILTILTLLLFIGMSL